MFRSARIKLTVSYLAIIMAITLSFSSFVYIGVSISTQKALESQKRRLERQLTRHQAPSELIPMGPMIDVETLVEIRNQTLSNLIIVNIVIFISSGSLGYLLAGNTLKPIEKMVNKQKRFISDAAHELKTPLTAMKTSLEVTLRDKKLTPKEAKNVLESTIEEVDKLHIFTQKLLKQSRYQNSSIAEHKEIRLEAIIKQAIESVYPLSKQKNISINTDLEPVKTSGDKEELEELFINLIDNAIKYSKKGSTINITVKKTGSFAEAIVEDFGIGIAKEELQNIFEPFYRADKSRSSNTRKGYGLGLAISKEIAEKHKGKISVKSIFGSGSKFTVRLPISF